MMSKIKLLHSIVYYKKRYWNRNTSIKLNLYPGLSLSIFYFIIFNKKRKYFIFLGLLLNLSKIRSSFSLVNSIHGEIIKIKFNLKSPNILFIEKCYKYHFYSSKNKFFPKKKITLTNFLFYRTKFRSHSRLVEINIYKLIMYYYLARLNFNIAKKKKLKKLKKKFRY